MGRLPELNVRVPTQQVPLAPAPQAAGGALGTSPSDNMIRGVSLCGSLRQVQGPHKRCSEPLG